MKRFKSELKKKTYKATVCNTRAYTCYNSGNKLSCCCHLRFKSKGAAGWLRALTVPVEKVIVKNDEGQTENRYLFSLGKAVHK